MYPAAENSCSGGVDMAGMDSPLPALKEWGIDPCSSSTNSKSYPSCQCRECTGYEPSEY